MAGVYLCQVGGGVVTMLCSENISDIVHSIASASCDRKRLSYAAAVTPSRSCVCLGQACFYAVF